ncbi:MAG: hypothetical protein PHH26_07765 [Candidatus Thermoplasmatota archaeon]|nr:hypothetical protein [Candidatus Thermoplasmatota archaeon]
MAISFTVASLATAIPALAIMLIFLGKHEKQFDEKQLFMTFVFAIIAAALSMLVASLASFENWFVLFVILAALSTVVESLLLNRRKFIGMPSAVFYGSAFGLGFGTLVGTYFSKIYTDVVLWAISAFALLLAHAAAGTLSGYGSFQKKKTKYILLSLAVKLGFYFAVTGFLTGSIYANYAISGISLAGAAALFAYSVHALYPKAN